MNSMKLWPRRGMSCRPRVNTKAKIRMKAMTIHDVRIVEVIVGSKKTSAPGTGSSPWIGS